jgi:hypothetical protein
VFKKKKPATVNYQPTPKGMYAWTSVYAGSFLLYVESLKDCHKFIFLPGPSEFYLTFEDFNKSLTTNVLEFVEQLPDEIYNETIEFSLSSPPNPQKVFLNENNNT